MEWKTVYPNTPTTTAQRHLVSVRGCLALLPGFLVLSRGLLFLLFRLCLDLILTFEFSIDPSGY